MPASPLCLPACLAGKEKEFPCSEGSRSGWDGGEVQGRIQAVPETELKLPRAECMNHPLACTRDKEAEDFSGGTD